MCFVNSLIFAVVKSRIKQAPIPVAMEENTSAKFSIAPFFLLDLGIGFVFWFFENSGMSFLFRSELKELSTWEPAGMTDRPGDGLQRAGVDCKKMSLWQGLARVLS